MRPSRSTVWAVAATILLASFGASAQDDRVVRLATLNWEPYYGEELPEEGFFTALVRAAFDEVGYELEVEYMPWARALRDAEMGYRDGLHGAYYSDERAQKFWVSDNVYDVDVGLIARAEAGMSEFERISDLAPYTIGIGRGFAHSDEFDQAVDEGRLNVEAEEDQILNIRKLYAGRIDMMADSLDLFRYEAPRQGHDLDDVVFVEPPLVTNELTIMISREVDGGEQVIDAFNEGLERIRESGEYEEILERFGML